MKKWIGIVLVVLLSSTACFAVDATTQATTATQTAALRPLEKITKREFRQKIWNPYEEKKFKYKGNKPILIEFNAQWCIPCKKLKPTLMELCEEYQDRVTFYEIDIDDEANAVPHYPDEFHFDRIPAMIVIKPGQKKLPNVYRIGGLDKQLIKNIIDEELK